MRFKTRVVRADAEGTVRLGRELGGQLRPGDIVALYGDLGSGKTTLTKGIAEALGIPGREITSASFTIIAEHEGRLPLYHVDLYRLSEDAAADVGLEDYLGTDGIVVIEWPERYSRYLPDERMNVTIWIVPEGRIFEIQSEREVTISE